MENIQDMVLTGDSGGVGKAGRVMAPHGAGGLYLQSVVVRDGLSSLCISGYLFLWLRDIIPGNAISI